MNVRICASIGVAEHDEALYFTLIVSRGARMVTLLLS
jgi:hypothetical protein